MLLQSFLLSMLVTPAHAGLPLGSRIDDAILVDVTPSGFDVVESMAPSLIPSDIPIPYTYINDEWEECVYDPFFGFELGCGYVGYEVEIDNGWVRVAMNDLDVMPLNGVLGVVTSVDTQLNDTSDPMRVYGGTYVGFSVLGFDVPLPEIGETCNANISPFAIDVEMTISMAVDTNGQNLRYLDVGFPYVDWDIGLSQSDLNLTDCLLGDINEVLNWLGLDLVGFIIDFLDPVLDDQIQDLLTQLEEPVETASLALNISEEISLGEATMALTAFPSEVTIVPSGMRIGMGGAIDAQMAECIAKYNPQGSLETPYDPPDIAESAPGITKANDFLAFIGDEFVNQALYGAWYAGILCQTVVDDGSLPIGINTSLLDLIAPEYFTDLFPTTEPLIIETRPFAAPEAYADGPSDINVELNELGLDFYAGLDGRMARVIGLELNADIGVDTNFNKTTGELGIAIDLSSNNMSASVTFNELVADANEAFEEGILGLVDSLAGSLLDSLLGDLVFPLPAMEGLGVTALEIAASGPGADYFGAHAGAGAVTYGAGGCSCDGSNPSDGCDSGCTTGALSARGIVVFIPMLFAAIRRRRND